MQVALLAPDTHKQNTTTKHATAESHSSISPEILDCTRTRAQLCNMALLFFAQLQMNSVVEMDARAGGGIAGGERGVEHEHDREHDRGGGPRVNGGGGAAGGVPRKQLQVLNLKV